MPKPFKYYYEPDPYWMHFRDNVYIDFFSTFTRYDIWSELLDDILHPIIGLYHILRGTFVLPFHGLCIIFLSCCGGERDRNTFYDYVCQGFVDDLQYIADGLIKLLVTPFILFKIITRVILMKFQEKSFVEDIAIQEIENKNLVNTHLLISNLQQIKNDKNIVYVKEEKENLVLTRKFFDGETETKTDAGNEYALLERYKYDIRENIKTILNLYKQIASIGYHSNFHEDFISDGEKLIAYFHMPAEGSKVLLSKYIIDFAEAWISHFLKSTPEMASKNTQDSEGTKITPCGLFKNLKKEEAVAFIASEGKGYMKRILP